MTKRQEFSGHTWQNDNGNITMDRQLVDTTTPGDHGCDPLGEGKYRMVPSGDIVNVEEMQRRLSLRK